GVGQRDGRSRKPIDGGKGGHGGGGLRRSRYPDRGGIEDHVAQQAQAQHGDASGCLGSRSKRDEPHLPGTRHRTRESGEGLRETQGAIETGRGGKRGDPATGGPTETHRGTETGPTETRRGAEG